MIIIHTKAWCWFAWKKNKMGKNWGGLLFLSFFLIVNFVYSQVCIKDICKGKKEKKKRPKLLFFFSRITYYYGGGRKADRRRKKKKKIINMIIWLEGILKERFFSGAWMDI